MPAASRAVWAACGGLNEPGSTTSRPTPSSAAPQTWCASGGPAGSSASTVRRSAVASSIVGAAPIRLRLGIDLGTDSFMADTAPGPVPKRRWYPQGHRLRTSDFGLGTSDLV